MEIIFTKHLETKRELRKDNKNRDKISKNRLVSGVTQGVMRLLLTPFEKELLDNEGRYLFIIKKDKNTDVKCYFLIVVEDSQFILISSLETDTDSRKYSQIDTKNIRLIENYTLQDYIDKNKQINKLKRNKSKSAKNRPETLGMKHKEYYKYVDELTNNIDEKVEKNGVVFIPQKKSTIKRKPIKIKKVNSKKIDSNPLKTIYDLINSDEFLTYSGEKRRSILKEQQRLKFYDKFESIDNEDIIPEFNKIFDIFENKKIEIEINTNVNKDYIQYLINTLEENKEFEFYNSYDNCLKNLMYLEQNLIKE